MPWFYCDACGDSVKKPKVAGHMQQCYTSSFTCIDCSRQFDCSSVHGHTQCVTEHDKYAKGATKPGGFAEKGYYDGGRAGNGEASKDVVGAEFLSTSAPWVCQVCNVTCTSRQTLEGHATGAKHVRRVKARLKESQSAVPATNGHVGDEPAKKEDAKERKKSSETEKKSSSKKKNKEKKKTPFSSQLKTTVTEALKKHGGEMKKKKLLKSLESFLEKHGCTEKKVEKKLSKSSAFSIDGKMVKLV